MQEPNLELLAYATSPGVTPQLLAQVADVAASTGDITVLVAVAEHGATDEETLLSMSRHDAGAVRAGSVRSGRLPVDRAREMVWNDTDLVVLFELARRPGLGDDAVDVLAAHPEAYVRQGVPENPDASVERLKAMFADTDPTVAAAAREHAEARGVKVEHPDEEPSLDTSGGVPLPGASLVPPGPGAPAALTDAEVDALVAGSPAERREAARLDPLPDRHRATLAGDTEAVVRGAFFRRGDLTGAEQDLALADPEAYVLAAYAVNADADPARRDTLATHAGVARVTEDHALQLDLADDVEAVQEQLAVRIEELPADVVVVLSRSSSRKVRKQVALNRDEAERLDGLWASELVEWKLDSWKERLTVHVQGGAYAKALELAPDFAGPLTQLAVVATTLV